MTVDLAGITLVGAGLLLLPFFGMASLVAVLVLLRIDHAGGSDSVRRSLWRRALASSFGLGIACVIVGLLLARNLSHSALNSLDETWWLWGPVPLVAYVSLVLGARRRYHRARATQSAPPGERGG